MAPALTLQGRALPQMSIVPTAARGKVRPAKALLLRGSRSMPDGSPPNDASHSRVAWWRQWLRMTWPQMRNCALGYIIGGAGSLLFLLLKLPLPWFLGSLSLCLIASVFHVPVERPRFLAIPTRTVLGVAVGTAFTPAL